MRNDVGLIGRARTLARHLVARATLESLAESADLAAFARSIVRLGPDLEPVGDRGTCPRSNGPSARRARGTLATLRRWQGATAGPIEIVSADFDRKSIRRMKYHLEDPDKRKGKNEFNRRTVHSSIFTCLKD